ncbi:hypothetical protein AUEXF2481DRAFT_30477 [Aureobasidium subglaciale EXF-2481]|uniref:Wax synthase domain-containing protein n=1 Tax=Aureobasidium subglaciale (strain EXF-2481) TaxID=1043005 RepID=A0A074Z6D1_AURSE|nr:uncharacterized protein AUEXF2481DRAFT_30477 [Aureobasidium subglaciale EXF-2481]KAI5196711.1 hypothetical protein E4T38_08369 [Aureobasidium subglaciale]KAI5214181.1 hypothetical protein E4T40_09168 [Aureobasidium subglaciale]KAI5216706.1 hypothetical protein E4T41_09169 [Aureobasidium subglaciale]KAI5256444.1 hypothetical protein E4T46_08269 [Aureobasidium subglaciale]KEQ94506.1 hypothetical protein AUEXF2481DRAFT_30477 [Aureobasidium subglaciale EXF-2481]
MATALTYDKLVNRIVPGPQSLSYFIPLVILPIAFAIPPWVISKQALCAITLPIITASLIHAWIVMGGIDVISFDMLLHSYHLLLFNDPRRHFRRVVATERSEPATAKGNQTPLLGNSANISVKDESTTPRYVEQSYPSNWNERLPWIGTLIITMRFVDWKIGSPSHDSIRLLRSAIMALQVWATVGQQFQLPCTVPVALHWAGYLPDAWSPHLWPTFFGSFRAMFTTSSLGAVRNFWGRYWHQTLRFYCSSPGVWLSDLLHLSRRSYARYVLLAATTFFLSGIVHIGLVPRDPMFAVESANQIRLRIATFFWLQPVGFAIEMAASIILRRLGTPKSVYVMLNILWFMAWCCFVLPPLGEAGRNLGYWRMWPVPLSLWRGLIHGKWLTWF